jgi:hypothetical protein
MAQVTLDGGQSSVALGGQTITYVEQSVAQLVGGAPDTLIQTQLQRVLNDFYTRSTAFRAVLDNPLTIYQGVSEYPINPVSQNLRLQFVLGAFLFPYQGSNEPLGLPPTTRKLFGITPGPPARYFMQTPDVLVLYTTPDQTYGPILNIYGSLVPTQLSAILPDQSYTQHADALIWGTLARLYAIPKRPWSDKELRDYYEKKYRREILIYRDIANRGYGPADTSTRFPPFAGRAESQVMPKASG